MRARRRRMRRVDLALVLVAIAVAVGIGFVVWPSDPAAPDAVPVTLATEDPPVALFLGDSFTSGSGREEQSYACMAATQMGWVCRLAAVPGTGFINGGSSNRFEVNQYTGELTTSFAERIQRLPPAVDPDIVVLDGGRNDGLASPEGVYLAMVSTIEQARQTWPDAQLVMIRPRYLADPQGHWVPDDEFMERLRLDPATQGLVFVDPIGAAFQNVDVSGLLAADGMHPNAQGDSALSDALVDALRQAGVQS